jgi:hypothetical protein
VKDVRFQRTLFFVAGIYGIVVLLPQYFLEAKTGRDYPPPITHPEFYYGFIGVALAWQILFLLLARDPVRYRAIMIPAILEKAGFGIAVLILYSQQRVSPVMLGAAIIDLTFGALFALAYMKTAARHGER